jgi:hypothetical protein
MWLESEGERDLRKLKGKQIEVDDQGRLRLR